MTERETADKIAALLTHGFTVGCRVRTIRKLAERHGVVVEVTATGLIIAFDSFPSKDSYQRHLMFEAVERI